MKLMLQKNIVKFLLALLVFPFLEINAQTPVPMASQPANTYTENFADMANWTNNFAAGIGANRWTSYPITAGGSANDGKRTTKSSATFVTTTAGGVQKGTQNLVFLSTGSGSPSESVAVDLLLDFTGMNAGSLSFNWAAVDNGGGTRPTSLRVFWSIDNSTFTEIAQVIDIQSVNSGSITNVTLPTAFHNSATARLRFYNHAGTVTGAGTRDKIAIDDVVVTSTPGNTPLIVATGTLTALSTTYGTPSATTQFAVSGSNLTVGITITPPAGFEVSTTSDFSSAVGDVNFPLSIGSAGTISSTPIYVRLSATAAAGNHTGNIVLASTDALSVNVATTATNTVTAKGLTITGITADDKTFDNTTTATLSGTPVLVGVVSGEELDVTVGGTPVANFIDAAIGDDKPVTVTGYILEGASAPNYTLTQPTGLTADILPSGLLDQTITFNPLTAVTYGVAPFNLTATSTSNLTVTYLSSDTDVATIAGNVITIVGAGTVTITAQQAGNGSYNAAIDVTQDLVVNPKALTIAGAAAQDKFYDGTATATVTGTLNGVINSDAVTLNLSGTFADETIGNNKPVTSTSTLSGADAANYTLTQPLGLTASITAGPCGPTVGTGTFSWNFTAGAAPSGSTSYGNAASSIGRGHNNGTTTLITTASASSGYAGVSGTQNAGAAAFVGPLNTDTSTYFEFTLTPDAGLSVRLDGISFGSRSTGSGPQAFTLRCSIDNYGIDIATGTLPNNSSWVLRTPTVVLVSDSAPVTYRLYGHDGSGSASVGTANWRIDDVIVHTTALSFTALTSPSTATACSGQAFAYTPTTAYQNATITWTRAAVAGISNAAVTTPQSSAPSEILVNTTNAPINVVYVFTVTTPTCYISQNVTVTVDNCVTDSVVNLKLFVQGYYAAAGMMTTVSDNQGTTSGSTDVETITVELRNATAPHELAASATAMLHTDGTAVCNFTTSPNGSYYIVVKTRNAVETWSATPQTVGSTPLNYDFSAAASQAFGDNMVQMATGIFALFSGDISVAGIQDGFVDLVDYSSWEFDNNTFAIGSYASDLNGDGFVDLADYSIWETNNNSFIGSILPQ